MKTIRFVLSKKSIDQAIQETRDFEAKLNKLCEVVAKKLAAEGTLAAREALAGYGGIDTGELYSSISCDCVRPGLWKVSCYAPNDRGENYAWYVEYGTGAVGAQSPHPEAGTAGWEYDVNGHGDEGWFYPFGKSRKHKLRLNPATGKYQPWTDGEPAKPFMYDSRQHIQNREVADRIMREAFEEVFG